ncbi:MAG: lytic transglycosylase domain-containing protein, partial [Bacteroidales bacterium]
MKFGFLGFMLCLPFITFCSNGVSKIEQDTVKTVCIGDEQIAPQNITIPVIPNEASFAGEAMPLEYFDVRESLQREMTVINYWHASLSYIVQLSGRYKEMIEQILKEEGVPLDFFYLCVAESSLQPLTSSANARGYWQFLGTTGKEYGLEITGEVDERYNWEKSTRAACKYFKKAFAKYGSWTLAAASYNVGMNSIDNRSDLQLVNSYYDMQLPLETSRYVYRAVAFKIIMNNLKDYGFNIKEEDKYKPLKYNIVEVKGPIL